MTLAAKFIGPASWLCFVWITLIGGTAAFAAPNAATPASTAESYGKLPLSFEVNEGQADGAVRFLSRGHGYTLFLTAGEAVLRFTAAEPASVVTMSLAGGSRDPRVMGEARQPTLSNYFLGNDPRRWHTAVSNYGQVRYQGVYPGIDLVYRGSQRQIEYDFVLAPGADPEQIGMVFHGTERIALGPNGELVLSTAQGDLVHHPPVVYQEIAGERRPIAGRYVLRGRGKSRAVGFAVSGYDRARPLVIDPVLSFSMVLGGIGDSATSIAVDRLGSVYITGKANYEVFPGVGPGSILPHPRGVQNAFVTKINPAGTAIVYSTFLGGDGIDVGLGIAVDAEGNAYVAGNTMSESFPGVTDSSIQPHLQMDGPLLPWGTDGFVTKINPTGTAIVYSTFLGGVGPDWIVAIAVDAVGGAYVTGPTVATMFPGITPASIQASHGAVVPVGGFPGANDAFVTKINPAGTAIEYSTFLGGKTDDEGTGIAVDAAGSAYVTGYTRSTDFPVTPGSIQSGLKASIVGLTQDAFVTKINPAGTKIDYSTFLGGNVVDLPTGIALDSARNAYIVGQVQGSSSPAIDFPGTTVGPIQRLYGGGSSDGFLIKINADGRGIGYSTFLGGADSDAARGIAVDAAGSAHVTGSTRSSSFPGVSSLSMQPSNRGQGDVFVLKIDPVGAIEYSTFLGGSASDFPGGAVTYSNGPPIAIDDMGGAYITGATESGDFPKVGTGSIIQSAGAGFFVAKIQSPSRHWTAVASTGSVDEAAAGFYAFTDAALGYLPGSPAVDRPIVARYDVTSTANAAHAETTPWNTLELGYFDNAPGSSVTARLIQVERCTGAPTEVCRVTSVDAANRTCQKCAFSTPIDFTRFSYYVEVTLLRRTVDLVPQALTLRLY
jgi:hypothetical protein